MTSFSPEELDVQLITHEFSSGAGPSKLNTFPIIRADYPEDMASGYDPASQEADPALGMGRIFKDKKEATFWGGLFWV